MYRDNTLMPKEAVRLAVLGTLIQAGSMHYADLASGVRHFLGRVAGPSLDLMGTSLELLRCEGLVQAVDGTGMEDNALLTVTPEGREAFNTLMGANLRSPSADELNKLVLALKLRFLHLLAPADRKDEADALVDLYEAELARLQDLRRHQDVGDGYLTAWLDHDIALTEQRLDWFRDLHASL